MYIRPPDSGWEGRVDVLVRACDVGVGVGVGVGARRLGVRGAHERGSGSLGMTSAQVESLAPWQLSHIES